MPLPKQQPLESRDTDVQASSADVGHRPEEQNYPVNERHARDLQRRLHAAYSKADASPGSEHIDGRSTIGRFVSRPPVALLLTAGLFVFFVVSAVFLVLPALIMEAALSRLKPAS